MSTTNAWIRTVYLYLFALVGLIVTVIGSIMLLNLALKAWVFTKADQPNYYYPERPQPLVYEKDVELVENLKQCGEICELTEGQRQQIDNWLVDYETWRTGQQDMEKIDYRASQRQQQASTAVSMILVGLPLYLYHWTVIKRDRRREEKV